MADYLQAQLLCAETDIHAVAGLLKKYFRELPEPLFTNALYPNFVDGLCKYLSITLISYRVVKAFYVCQMSSTI